MMMALMIIDQFLHETTNGTNCMVMLVEDKVDFLSSFDFSVYLLVALKFLFPMVMAYCQLVQSCACVSNNLGPSLVAFSVGPCIFKEVNSMVFSLN